MPLVSAPAPVPPSVAVGEQRRQKGRLVAARGLHLRQLLAVLRPLERRKGWNALPPLQLDHQTFRRGLPCRQKPVALRPLALQERATAQAPLERAIAAAPLHIRRTPSRQEGQA